jgi:hypothetical protein
MKKNLAKLVKKKVTDKNGVSRYVWVKQEVSTTKKKGREEEEEEPTNMNKRIIFYKEKLDENFSSLIEKLKKVKLPGLKIIENPIQEEEHYFFKLDQNIFKKDDKKTAKKIVDFFESDKNSKDVQGYYNRIYAYVGEGKRNSFTGNSKEVGKNGLIINKKIREVLDDAVMKKYSIDNTVSFLKMVLREE